MSKRPTSRKRFSGSGANLRPIRLALETLETRRLLAGMDLSDALGSALFCLERGDSATAAQQTSHASQSYAAHQAPPDSALGLRAEGEQGKNSFELLENAAPRTVLGPITFYDPLPGQQHTLHSDDPRFGIEGNELYFVGGELDFETESAIGFVVTVVSDTSEVIARVDVAVSVGDVNERPQAIELGGGKVHEKDPGAIIGALQVVDPDRDAQGDYAYYLFDARFSVSGNQLRLADGVDLDYATEPEIMLAIAATDGVYEVFDTVRIEVLPQAATPAAASTLALTPRQVNELTAGAPVGRATVVDAKDGSYRFSVSDGRFEFVGDQLKLRNNRQINAALDPEISLTVTAVGDQGDKVSGTFLIAVNSFRSPYHNYNLNEDVNGDGFVSPIDALLVINELNRRGAGPISTVGGGAGEGAPVMHDVNGDGVISPIDILLIINYLNSNRSIQNQPSPNGLNLDSPAPNVVEQTITTDSPILGQDNTESPVADSAAGKLSLNTDLLSVDEQSPQRLIDAAYDAAAANFFAQLNERPSERRLRENAAIDAELELLLEQLSVGV